MQFRVAHFSDVHLGPVEASDILGSFRLKRLIGGTTWHFRRKRWHRRAVLDALRADIRGSNPDHVCCTGDLVNIGGRREFERGLKWLSGFEDAEELSFVPGNHDAYVRDAWERGSSLLSAYATPTAKSLDPADQAYPFVRLRRNVAIIGINSARPQALHSAAGTLGERQRNALASILTDLGARGFYRLVMIHHPPLPGLTAKRRALTDARELSEILESNGAELVLHGHNHVASRTSLKTRKGRTEIFGVPSASMDRGSHDEPAAWNLYAVSRDRGQWRTDVTVRQWRNDEEGFGELERFSFTSAPES